MPCLWDVKPYYSISYWPCLWDVKPYYTISYLSNVVCGVHQHLFTGLLLFLLYVYNDTAWL